MTSNIDETKPTAVEATTVSIRDNFATAKTEITALQELVASLTARVVALETKVASL